MTNNLFIKKTTVDELSKDFTRVISQYEKNKPDAVKTSMSGKYQRIQVDIDQDIQLIVYQSSSEVKEAYYVCFDDDSSTIYKRNLIQ